MISFINYLLFCFRATNQQGLHSPFVFDLYQTCFRKSRWKSIKKYPWTPSHFSQLDVHFKELLLAYFSKYSASSTSYQIFFKPHISAPECVEKKPHSIFVYSGIHNYRRQWEELTLGESIRLDFYFWGIVFFKTDQQPQRFLLRIL